MTGTLTVDIHQSQEIMRTQHKTPMKCRNGQEICTGYSVNNPSWGLRKYKLVWELIKKIAGRKRKQTAGIKEPKRWTPHLKKTARLI